MSTSNWSNSNSLSTKASFIPSTEEAILTASDKATNNYFGQSIAVSADNTRVVIGAFAATAGAYVVAGVAYVFIYSGGSWSQEAKLIASLNGTGNSFGYSVAINSDGSRIISGVPCYDLVGADSGRCFIFIRSGSTWSQEAILTASDTAAQDNFGWSVSINTDGSRVIVGSPYADPAAIADAGKAYIFTRSGTTWSQEAILSASDKAAGDLFGWSVSMASDGTRCVIGAYNADPSGVTNAGKAYIFTRSGTTWTQEAILSASDKASNDNFGYSASITADASRIAVGAYRGVYNSMIFAGRVYIFTRSGTTWSLENILDASDSSSGAQFGSSVSINSDGSKVAIGAKSATIGGYSGAGAAYIFSRSGSTWTQSIKVTASNRQTNDNFGTSVSLDSSGTHLLVGNPYSDPASIANAGAVYSYN